MRGALLAELLGSLSRSPSLVPDDGDRACLARAAGIIESGLVVSVPVRVLILSGPEYDPVAATVDDLQSMLQSVSDKIACFDDQLDDLRRLVRKSA